MIVGTVKRFVIIQNNTLLKPQDKIRKDLG